MTNLFHYTYDMTRKFWELGLDEALKGEDNTYFEKIHEFKNNTIHQEF